MRFILRVIDITYSLNYVWFLLCTLLRVITIMCYFN